MLYFRVRNFLCSQALHKHSYTSPSSLEIHSHEKLQIYNENTLQKSITRQMNEGLACPDLWPKYSQRLESRRWLLTSKSSNHERYPSNGLPQVGITDREGWKLEGARGGREKQNNNSFKPPGHLVFAGAKMKIKRRRRKKEGRDPTLYKLGHAGPTT